MDANTLDNHIDGQWAQPMSGETIDVVSADNVVITRLSCASVEDLPRASAAGDREALEYSTN